MSEVEKKLFIVELFDDDNKTIAYWLAKAGSQEAAIEIACCEFTDRGYECTQSNMYAYEYYLCV